MPSPFPGMNPYLEHVYVWHDFHQTFVPALREALWVHVRPRYFVKVEDHLYVQKPDEQRRKVVGVVRRVLGVPTPGDAGRAEDDRGGSSDRGLDPGGGA